MIFLHIFFTSSPLHEFPYKITDKYKKIVIFFAVMDDTNNGYMDVAWVLKEK